MRDYTALSHEYYEEMSDLTDEEFGRLIRALLKYSIHAEETQLTGNERFFYRRVINREQRYQSAFDDMSRKHSEAGRKAAQARWDREQEMRSNAIAYNTKTKTDSKTKTKTYSKTKSYAPSSKDERSFEERLGKDILELERFTREIKEREERGEELPCAQPGDREVTGA